MTSVDGASRAQPPRPSHHPSRAEPGDVRAMQEALDAARGRIDKTAPQPGKRGLSQANGKPEHGKAEHRTDHGRAELGRSAGPDTTDQTEVVRRSQREGNDALGPWNGQPGAVPTPTTAANFPAAHVDPGGFAQMLADLWTRENGRGSKEVWVRFGDRAWPATGARLVRNAAGTLDVALLVGDGGQAYGNKLSGLEDALADAGVNLGRLSLEADA